MAVQLSAIGGYLFVGRKLLQVVAQFRAGVRSHASADSQGQMIRARKRPDVAFELRQKLDDDFVRSLWDEIALSNFQFILGQRANPRQMLVTRSRSQYHEIRAVPLAFHGITRLI